MTSYLDVAEQEGAKVLTGGRGDGWWVKPTVLANVSQDMRVVREEIFGPVVMVQPFDGRFSREFFTEAKAVVIEI